MQNVIEILPYDPNWTAVFKKEAGAIHHALGVNCTAVHHIGSTAVPGLCAKPIIDILPVVSDISNVDAESIQQAMDKLGYWSRGENGIPFRRYFQKGDNPRVANVHVYEQNHTEVERQLKFRDWLIEHPQDRDAYAALKLELAHACGGDVFAYMCAKSDFVKRIDTKTGSNGYQLAIALAPDAISYINELRTAQNHRAVSADETLQDIGGKHFVLYKGPTLLGYCWLSLLEDNLAEIQLFSIKEEVEGAHETFINLITKWLSQYSVKLVKD